MKNSKTIRMLKTKLPTFNIISSNKPKNLTIATACMNREANLKQAIQSWLKLSPAQIIICDWGSTIPLTHKSLGIEKNNEAVVIHRQEAEHWVASWAFNEALSKVTTKFVLKLDCDHIVSKDIVKRNKPRAGCFSRGHYKHAKSGQQYINGAFISCVNILRRVGYYDERITTYGREDGDLYQRLYDICHEASNISPGSLIHLAQDETTRTKEQNVIKETMLAEKLKIKTTEFLIARNKILCGMMEPWNLRMYSHRKEIRHKFLEPGSKEQSLIEVATKRAFVQKYKRDKICKITGISAKQAYFEILDESTKDS